MRKRKASSDSEDTKRRLVRRRKTGVTKSKTKKKSLGKLAQKAAKPDYNTNIEGADEITLDDFAGASLTHYGSYVVEERAVPDYRDGLKPVHRYILWAMHDLGINSRSGYKKSARTIGDVLGKYHPHGDQSAYGAMSTLVNYKLDPQLVQGQGNWGTPVDPHAAMRYTEARLSAFSDIFLLDKHYLKTVPKIDNFDQTLKVPLYLPATLPTLMITGSSGIGFGIASSNPPFGVDGVYKMAVSSLKAFAAKKKVTYKTCMKNLTIDYGFGCTQVSGDDEMEDLFKTGKASIKFVPEIKVDPKTKTIEIVSFAPGFRSVSGIQKKLDKIAGWDGVSRAGDNSGAKNKKAGKLGAYYYVTASRGTSEQALYDLADRVYKEVTGSESYDLGFTIRNHEDRNQFIKSGYPAYFNNWAKYRFILEHKAIAIHIEERKAAIALLELKVLAVDKRDIIMQVLKSKTKDLDATLAKKLRIPLEDAKTILNLQTRRLAALEKPQLLAEIKDLKSQIRDLQKDDANPLKRILRITKEQYDTYRKRIK